MIPIIDANITLYAVREIRCQRKKGRIFLKFILKYRAI